MEQNIAPPSVWAALRRPGIPQLVEDIPTGHDARSTLEVIVLEADEDPEAANAAVTAREATSATAPAAARAG